MKLHLIYTPFTGVGVHGGFRGDEWFKDRILLFKDYCLKSLRNQTNKDFIHWISFRAEEKDHLFVRGLDEYLTGLYYPHIFTFDGLMYIDDKFVNYGLISKLRNILQMFRDDVFNRSFHPFSYYKKYAWDNKNDSLVERVHSSLSVIREKASDTTDWVYLTRIDSDDMLGSRAIELIQTQEPKERRALVFEKGYILNKETNQLADWNPPTNPPFHTIIFPGKVFWNAALHLAYYRDFRSHEDIPRLFDCVKLDESYCVLFHQKHHISTSWTSPLDKKFTNLAKYGKMEPHRGREYKPYLYLTHGKNISTRWKSRSTQVKNKMIGQEYGKEEEKETILKQFGL